MRVKICGITQLEQAEAIATLGATTLGFICVSQSPRYVSIPQLQAIVPKLPSKIDKIGVFANANWELIQETVTQTGLTGVQLHGDESLAFCQQLRKILPTVEIIKAIRVKSPESLAMANSYSNYVDTLLLDTYHPQLLGGTGTTLNWSNLKQFHASKPWLLAGGLNPDNILTALAELSPDGIDVSSGVERSPGHKDLELVARLFTQLKLSGLPT